ncbi:MAG: hypothetical protein ACLPX9_03980 [Rhodomicrobium sp.]
MSVQKSTRPAFLSVELDPIDERLETRAAERGIPTLVAPKLETPAFEEVPALAMRAAVKLRKPAIAKAQAESTPRSRMVLTRFELPDYVWIELKKRAAEKMVSLRYILMSCLREQGFTINDADMIEDGRKLR